MENLQSHDFVSEIIKDILTSQKNTIKLTDNKKFFQANINNPIDYFSKYQLRKHLKDNYKNLEISNYNELFEFISSINPKYFFKKELKKFIDKQGKIFDCLFFENHYAWIAQDKKKIYRYFSKNHKGEVKSYNMIDFFELYFNRGTFRAIDKAIKTIEIPFMENEWVQEQYRKYNYNLNIIHSLSRSENNYIQKFIAPHLKFLETINVIGSINIKKKEFSYDDESLFFVSNSYLSHFIKDISRGKANKLINYFAVLGLIRKVNSENIPGQLLYKSKEISSGLGLNNHINYYIIPPLKEGLENTIKKLEKLDAIGLTYSNLNKMKVLQFFGKDFANEIYTQDDIVMDKKAIKISEQIELLVSLLKKDVLDNNYSTKENILEAMKEHNIPKSFLSKYWKYAIYANDFEYRKVNKKEKRKYNLEKYGFIVTSK